MSKSHNASTLQTWAQTRKSGPTIQQQARLDWHDVNRGDLQELLRDGSQGKIYGFRQFKSVKIRLENGVGIDGQERGKMGCSKRVVRIEHGDWWVRWIFLYGGWVRYAFKFGILDIHVYLVVVPGKLVVGMILNSIIEDFVKFLEGGRVSLSFSAPNPWLSEGVADGEYPFTMPELINANPTVLSASAIPPRAIKSSPDPFQELLSSHTAPEDSDLLLFPGIANMLPYRS
jgi:hypothetical protein